MKTKWIQEGTVSRYISTPYDGRWVTQKNYIKIVTQTVKIGTPVTTGTYEYCTLCVHINWGTGFQSRIRPNPGLQASVKSRWERKKNCRFVCQYRGIYINISKPWPGGTLRKLVHYLRANQILILTLAHLNGESCRAPQGTSRAGPIAGLTIQEKKLKITKPGLVNDV